MGIALRRSGLGRQAKEVKSARQFPERERSAVGRDGAGPERAVRREPPRKRRAAERNERDCELPPDLRRRQTITIEDGNGTARGVVRINPYAKRIAISGFGLVERKS